MTPVLYGDLQSGNCYKIQLLLSHLDIHYEFRAIDILRGDTQTKAFLSMNANGKIPVMALDNDRFLCESNAILNYYADGTQLLPVNKWHRAQVLSWQFFEQYSHEPTIAVARFIQHYLGLPDDRLEEYKSRQLGGYKALAVMEQVLSKNSYFVNDEFSIADISLYAYTHVAHEGGFNLDDYPFVAQWLERVANLDGHRRMGEYSE